MLSLDMGEGPQDYLKVMCYTFLTSNGKTPSLERGWQDWSEGKVGGAKVETG